MMKNIFWIVLILGLASCYEDLGNYDYHEINQVEITGIDSTYACDQFDTLRIVPKLEGTFYSDTSRFTYLWELDRKEIAATKDLVYWVTASLGEKICRYVITDKELGTKAFFQFRVRISSSTADDLIVVLSKYRGHAELSYKRLDKIEKPFVPNYYESLNDRLLGDYPKGIYQNFIPDDNNSGLQVLVDGRIKSLNQETMNDYAEHAFLDEGYFKRKAAPVALAPFADFSVEGVRHDLTDYSWSDFMELEFKVDILYIVAGGRFYSLNLTNSNPVIITGAESPYGGKLSPVVCPVYRYADPEESDFFFSVNGYIVSNYILLFDETHGRFVQGDISYKSRLQEIPALPAYPGYKLLWINYIHEKNYCTAVLAKGNAVKLVLIQAPGKANEVAEYPFAEKASLDIPEDIMNSKSKFYNLTTKNHMLFTTGNKLFRCNVLDWMNGQAPAAANQVASLKDYGFGDDAEITSMFMSRSERNLVLGISRYGDDTEGNGDELKGDVMVIDAENYQLYAPVWKGVCGYPVDIIVKYQEHYRAGKNVNGQMMDNI